MGDHYDLFLSVRLQPGLSDEVMYEIRWHLGVEDEPPTRFEALSDDAGWFHGEPVPLFAGLEPNYSDNGVDVAEIMPSADRYPDGQQRWLLTLRQSVHEDELGWAMDVAGWIVSKAETTGWVGFLRYSQDPVPDLLHHIDGRLRIGRPG